MGVGGGVHWTVGKWMLLQKDERVQEVVLRLDSSRGRRLSLIMALRTGLRLERVVPHPPALNYSEVPPHNATPVRWVRGGGGLFSSSGERTLTWYSVSHVYFCFYSDCEFGLQFSLSPVDSRTLAMAALVPTPLSLPLLLLLLLGCHNR